MATIAKAAEQAPPIPETLEHLPAAFEWRLRRLGDGEVSFAAFRGKTIVLDVWATWCKPCVAELPSLERLANILPQKRFAVVTVTDEEEPTVASFVAKQRLDQLPVYLLVDDLPRPFVSSGVPRTFVVDPRGEIVMHQFGGPHKWDDERFVDFLMRLERRPK